MIPFILYIVFFTDLVIKKELSLYVTAPPATAAPSHYFRIKNLINVILTSYKRITGTAIMV